MENNNKTTKMGGLKKKTTARNNDIKQTFTAKVELSKEGVRDYVMRLYLHFNPLIDFRQKIFKRCKFN